MAPKLYWVLASPPARAVLMCAKELGVELELVDVDMEKSENLKPEYLKMNPMHTVPVLDDDGFIVTDSHAIMTYLIGKYGKGSSLYPEEVKERCMVDQRLFFDSSILFAKHLGVCMPVIRQGVKTIPQEPLAALTEAFGALDVFLQNSKFVAGDKLTIADFSIWTTITNVSSYLPVEESKYPNITSWLQRMQKTPHNELNESGAEYIREKMKPLLKV